MNKSNFETVSDTKWN